VISNATADAPVKAETTFNKVTILPRLAVEDFALHRQINYLNVWFRWLEWESVVFSAFLEPFPNF
jgi:hypothetical protein